MPVAPEISSEQEALLDALRADPGSCAILSDVDGTLAPIVATPGEAAVPERTRELFARLASEYALVGCVSGRRAFDARRLVGLDQLTYVGIHGFERLLPGSVEASPNPQLRGQERLAEEFVEGLEPGLIAGAGLRLEDKGAIQALHWRGAADEDRALAAVAEISGRAGKAGLVGHRGRMVLEIRPPVEITKGTAIADLLAEHELDGCLYAGDDHTDVDAFQALGTLKDAGELKTAVRIGIASPESPPEISAGAEIVVRSPAELPPLLERLVA